MHMATLKREDTSIACGLDIRLVQPSPCSFFARGTKRMTRKSWNTKITFTIPKFEK